MRRRDFFKVVAGLTTAWPLAARAQQQAIPVIGFLNGRWPTEATHLIAAFLEGLKEAGFVDGQNVTIKYQWANGEPDRFPALVTDLINSKVALIVTSGGVTGAIEAKKGTATIPIVFLSGEDPVRLGLVASLGKPGGNATGFNLLSGELGGKRLGLLHELVPHAKMIAVLINSEWPSSASWQTDVEGAARALGLPIQQLQANSERDIDRAFTSMAQSGVDALLVGAGPFFDSRRNQLVALAAKAGIPAAYESHSAAAAGGLMSYGASVAAGYHELGVYAGRVLNGERPTELPVMQPTKFELVINLKTAKVLGLTVPPSLLARADEVIE
jgi:putative tryptophan/tyrosine transport system substrate-binding protein